MSVIETEKEKDNRLPYIESYDVCALDTEAEKLVILHVTEWGDSDSGYLPEGKRHITMSKYSYSDEWFIEQK